MEHRQAPEEHWAGPWLPEAGRIPLQGEQQQPHSRAQQLPPRGEIPQEPSAAASAARTPTHPFLTDPQIPTSANTRRQRCEPSCGAQFRLRAAPGPGRAEPGRVGPPAALATVARGGPCAKRAPHSTSGAPLSPSASPTARGDGFRGGGSGGDALRGSRGPGAAPPGQARARRRHRHRGEPRPRREARLAPWGRSLTLSSRCRCGDEELGRARGAGGRAGRRCVRAVGAHRPEEEAPERWERAGFGFRLPRSLPRLRRRFWPLSLRLETQRLKKWVLKKGFLLL